MVPPTIARSTTGRSAAWERTKRVGQSRNSSQGARAALIHEMLHTLGLRENPPSSAEITRWVTAACGASP